MFIFFTFFFDRSQKKSFSELKKKEYNFDVKNYDLSISEVFSAIAALLDGLELFSVKVVSFFFLPSRVNKSYPT